MCECVQRAYLTTVRIAAEDTTLPALPKRFTSKINFLDFFLTQHVIPPLRSFITLLLCVGEGCWEKRESKVNIGLKDDEDGEVKQALESFKTSTWNQYLQLG